MLSMPPATTTSASPARMACAASITALRPEPQTLLIVNAPTRVGHTGGDGGLTRRVLAEPGREHAAHDDLVDEFSNRGTHGAGNDDIHRKDPLVIGMLGGVAGEFRRGPLAGAATADARDSPQLKL
jgi:hypothetical protein